MKRFYCSILPEFDHPEILYAPLSTLVLQTKTEEEKFADRWTDNYNLSIMIGGSKFGGPVQDHHTYDMRVKLAVADYTVCACSQGIWRKI